MTADLPTRKICNVCLKAKAFSKFRIANGHRGYSDTCKACETKGRLFTCTKCGQEKPGSQFHVDSRKTSGLHSWCKACKQESTNKRQRHERTQHGSSVPDARKIAKGKPKLKPTALFLATPKKPQSKWTEEERAEWRRVLLDPERRENVRRLRENRTS